MPKSTEKTPTDKPRKPYPDFPLFAHATKRWAKKIKGKLHYFGRWDDPDAALEKYLRTRDDIWAGRKPRDIGSGVTVGSAMSSFVEAKDHLVETGEIAQRTRDDYRATCGRVVDCFGKNRSVEDLRPDDFDELRKRLSKTRGPVALGNEIQRVRVAFKYCYDAGLIDHPIRFGPDFKRPSRKVLRKERQRKGVRMFTAAELRKILKAANLPLRAMILLGANCGFGNSDCAGLPLSAIDLDRGWIDYPRPKTAVERRCPLWPETAQALREWLPKRPKAKASEHRDLVFITNRGGRFSAEGAADCAIAKEFRKLLDESGIHRTGLGFYGLRHGFETIAGDSRDQVATNHIMAHADASMAGTYRERIEDHRLQAVIDHVHAWLYPRPTVG